MTVFQALVLGVVQGLAEFLPISSSAHLALAPWLLGWEDPGLAFDVALHFGTLVALAWFFRKDWVTLAVAAGTIVRTRRVETVHQRRALFIVIATIPAGLTGLVIGGLAEQSLRAPPTIAVALIVMGALLWWSDRASTNQRNLSSIGWRDAVAIGLAQAFALIPGVSRSGATITAARALGLDRASAATFSFLLSFPITAAAVLVKVPEALKEGITAPLVVGVAAAAVSSAVAIAWLLRFVSRHSYGLFALYRLVAGVGVLAVWWWRR